MATRVLLRLAALTGDSRHAKAAERALASVSPFLVRYPTGFASWLSAASLVVDGIVELAIVGDPAGHDSLRLLAAASEGEPPNLVIAVAADPGSSMIPLLEGRTQIGGRSTAYVCRQFACRLPVTDEAALRDQLVELRVPG